MKLTKTDLKLFEIMDKEIDKDLEFGHFVYVYNNNTDEKEYILYDNTMEWEVVDSSDFDWLILPMDFKSYKIIDDWWDWYCVIKEVWLYPTTNEILRYVNKLVADEKAVINIETYEETIWFFNNDYFDNTALLYLDITQPIQDYSEKKKEELVNFLENINQ